MTKKKVEVNEDILKNIIVGDIPVFGREKPMNENTEQPGQESVPVKNTEPRLQLQNLLRYSLRKRPL
ncbi:hypothetical protein NXX77_23250 [Phocaeicola dorei]|nr:hypothetical protein [Phocaeicola dorei]